MSKKYFFFYNVSSHHKNVFLYQIMIIVETIGGVFNHTLFEYIDTCFHISYILNNKAAHGHPMITEKVKQQKR